MNTLLCALRGGLLTLLALLSLVGCSSLVVKDNEPLPADKQDASNPNLMSKGGYRLTNLTSDEWPDDLLVLVAMSGGGKRSAAFSFGALKGLDEITVDTDWGQRRLTDELDLITSVSGGSFPAAYWGLHHRDTFKEFPEAFLYQDIESYIFGIYLLPWRWGWLVDPSVGTNDYMDQVYDKLMFKGATYADLQKRGRPMIALGASDIAFGTPFYFYQPYFDLICSDLSTFPVSRAVAASNAFPGLFTPITLENHANQCGNRVPLWFANLTEEQKNNPFSLFYPAIQAVERYRDQKKSRYLHLMDGGITDNLALRGMLEQMTVLGLSSDSLINTGLTNYRRVLVISLDGQAAQDSAIAQRRLVGGMFTLFGLVSGAQIDRYNLETLRLINSQMPVFETALSTARCKQAPEINGHPCDDVSAAFIHIALSSLPEGETADRLRAIPTGLTIDKADVDALVSAGETLVTQSPALRSFIADYNVKAAKD